MAVMARIHQNDASLDTALRNSDLLVPIQALEGEVHTTPVRLTVMHAPLDRAFKMNQELYLLSYLGEGKFKYWMDGTVKSRKFSKLTSNAKSLDLSQCRIPSSSCWWKVSDEKLRNTWWIKVKTNSGKTGWINDGYKFSGNDGCS